MINAGLSFTWAIFHMLCTSLIGLLLLCGRAMRTRWNFRTLVSHLLFLEMCVKMTVFCRNHVSNPIPGILCCLAITFSISIFLHHSIEQFFRRYWFSLNEFRKNAYRNLKKKYRSTARTTCAAIALLYTFTVISIAFNVPLMVNESLQSTSEC